MGSKTQFPGDLSPFRTNFLKVALFYNGVWNDILMTDLGDDGVTIKRGRSGEAGSTEPSSCSFRLKDPTGKYSPRNPNSALYGLVGRGTPVRVQVEMVAGTVLDRWYGEVVTFEPHWSKTGSKDAYVTVECAGTLRRLGQGASPLRSPLYRNISTIGTNLVAYWPMEEQQFATQFAPAVGPKAITVSGSPSFGSYTGMPSSDNMATIGSASYSVDVPNYTATSPAVSQIRWVGLIPSTTPNGAVLFRAFYSGTLGYVELRYQTGGSIVVEGVADSGTSLGSTVCGLAVDNRNLRYSVELTQSGANISWSLVTLEAGATGGSFVSGTFTGATVGIAKTIQVNPNKSSLGSMPMAHLTVERVITSIFTVSASTLNGYLGETASDRIARLCSENGLTSTITPGPNGGSKKMGFQGRKDLLSLLRECEATDGGFLYEPKSTADVGYVIEEFMYSRTPSAFTYVDNMFLPFEPVEDDQNIRNTVTVQRDGGGKYTVQQTTGAVGTTAVGIYDSQVTLSLAADTDALNQANWRLHLGTTDEARWPQISVDLADPRIRVNASLRDGLLGVGLGSRVDISGIPSWLPPFTVSQIVVGYTEKITPRSYKITFVCVPARPYRVGYWGTATDRYSGEGTVLAAAITTTTATTFTITPPAGVTWTSADGSFGILINGEQMTVTNVTGTTFTVTRGVNGVLKTHAAGSAVALADPCYYTFM